MRQVEGGGRRTTGTTPRHAARDGGWSLGSRPALDGVRGLAIFLVVGVHLQSVWHAVPFIGGYVGVTVFFVLSGFLITSLLLEEHTLTRRISIGNFYRRRALRLLPALFALLIGAFVVSRLIVSVRVAMSAGRMLTATGAVLGGFYNMTVSFLYSWGNGWGIAHLWSLSVEMQFYLLWPLILVPLLRWRPGWIGVVTLAFTVEAWALGVVTDVVKHNVWYAYFSTPPNFCGLMLGAFVAWKLHSGWRPQWWSTPAALVGLVAIGWISVSSAVLSPSSIVWGNAVVALGAAALIVGVLDYRTPAGRLLSLRPLRYLGRISYSLYLWHFLVIWAVIALIPTASVATQVFWIVSVSAVTSVASYHLFEAPFIRYGKRLSPRRGRSETGTIDELRDRNRPGSVTVVAPPPLAIETVPLPRHELVAEGAAPSR